MRTKRYIQLKNGYAVRSKFDNEQKKFQLTIKNSKGEIITQSDFMEHNFVDEFIRYVFPEDYRVEDIVGS